MSDDRAARARERVRQAEQRLRRIQARREQLGAGATATPEAASEAAREARLARQQAAAAQDSAQQQRENSAVAHERAAATHEQLAASTSGDVTQHRIRAAWHREHAEAARSRLDEAGPASWRSAWDSPRPFSCERVDLDDVTVVVLTGEVDLDTSSEFRSVLYQAIRQGRSRLLIDMSETTFCDSSCLGVLVGAFRRARADLGWVRLVSPARQVAKVLRITYLDHVFPVHETLDEALAQVDIPQEELNARRWHQSGSC